jgi:hypothetical protein
MGLCTIPLIKYIVDRILIKRNEKYNTYAIKFKITFTTSPSIFDDTQKAKVYRTSDITLNISAKDNDDALETLNDILHQEVGYELTAIEQI